MPSEAGRGAALAQHAHAQHPDVQHPHAQHPMATHVLANDKGIDFDALKALPVA